MLKKPTFTLKIITFEYEATLYKDRLAYGAICPVTVTCDDANQTGVIIYPELDRGSDSDGKQIIICYSILAW